MNIADQFLAFTLLGSSWVLWLLIGLSVISVAIMIERGIYFVRHRMDVDALAAEIRQVMDQPAERERLAARFAKSDTIEAKVVGVGLSQASRGAEATAGRPTPSTSSSRAWPRAARTGACSSPAASSRCWPSAGRS